MTDHEPLALKYRPKSFADLTGQKAVRVVLAQMVKLRKVPPGILLTGPRGTGKTTTGRILAAALNCTHPETRPCGSCAQCLAIFGGTSMTVIEQDAASNGLVDDIRSLKARLMYSTDGEWRVVVLDEAHSMKKDAFNALLKVLEEPPPNTVFILITTEPRAIMETIKSRCMEFEFRRISTTDLRSRLEHICDAEGFSVEPALLDAIAERADGGMRDAVMTLDQMTSVGVKTLDSFNKLVGYADFAPALISAAHSRDLTAAYAITAEQLTRDGDPSAITSAVIKCLRDVMVLKSGGSLSAQGEMLEARIHLANRIELSNLFGACRVFWDLATKYKSSEDPRSALDLAIVMLTENISPKSFNSPMSSTTPQPKAKLSLADLASG